MNLNVVLRHELHALIKRATPDQLFIALHAQNSPIRDRFVRFLALSYADWLSTQSDVDDDNIKRQWRHALRLQPTGWFFDGKTGETGVATTEDGNTSVGVSSTLDGNSNTPGAAPQSNGMAPRNMAPGAASSTPGGGMTAGATAGGVTRGGPNGNSKRGAHPRAAKRLELKEKQPLEGFLPLLDKDIPPSHSPVPPLTGHLKLESGQLSPSAQDLLDDPNNAGNMGAAASRRLFDQLSMEQKQLLKAKLPPLSELTSIDKRNENLIRKLQLCCVPFNFHSHNIWEMKGIEKKKNMLTEILEYIAKYAWYREEILQQCIVTISKNLFRALPKTLKTSQVEEEPFEDPAWPHLQLVYDLTLRLVICTDVDKKIMRKYLEGRFVDNVIELFASEDPREREYLKTILHRIYGRFMPLRHLIRQSIANCCYRTIYERTRSENGIAEFLEIFCSIIHGFSIPVKVEHQDFLRNVLVPLHKCRNLEKFHEQLVACCVQFVFKDPLVAPVILGGLLKFWPVQSPTKEEMFIAEVVNVLNAMINHKNGFSWPDNREICLSVVDKLVECMQSNHHSVAERALLVWSEDAIEILVDLEKKTMWPKIVNAFLQNKSHWNESLRECNEDAMDGFRVRDHATFGKIREEFLKNNSSRHSKSAIEQKTQTRQLRWRRLQNATAAKLAKIRK